MTRLTQMHGQAGGYACQICNGKHPDVLATSCLITIVVSSHDGDIDGHDDIMRAADVLTRLQAHSHRGQSAAGPAGVKACDLHPCKQHQYLVRTCTRITHIRVHA